jgi:hypothetical protein
MLLHLFVHKLEEFPLQRFAKTLIRKRSYSQYGTLVVSEEGSDVPLKKEEEGQAAAAGRTGLHTINSQLASGRKSSSEVPKKQGGVRSWLWGSRSKQQQEQEQLAEEEEGRAIIQDMLGNDREESPSQGNTGQSEFSLPDPPWALNMSLTHRALVFWQAVLPRQPKRRTKRTDCRRWAS